MSFVERGCPVADGPDVFDVLLDVLDVLLESLGLAVVLLVACGGAGACDVCATAGRPKAADRAIAEIETDLVQTELMFLFHLYCSI